VVTRRASRLGWLWLWAAGLSACSAETEPRTQLMLVTDTDVAAPATVVFEIRGEGRPTETLPSPFESVSELPRTLAFVHSEGPLGPFTVSARVTTSTGAVIERSHQVSFQQGKTLVVPLHLLTACLSERCPEQCGELGCTPTLLDTSKLEPYSQQPDRVLGMDAGSEPVDAGQGNADAAAPVDAGEDAGPAPVLRMCDGEQVDIQRSLEHCGRCGNECVAAPPGQNSTGVRCVAGSCALDCVPGFADCNNRAMNGCEVELSSSDNHCGKCGMRCVGNTQCEESMCVQ
jgi:hypothetical protein